ncbi:MAG: hypothetical protein WCW16_03425 [Candidatus Magasanikbacteria bacterium]
MQHYLFTLLTAVFLQITGVLGIFFLIGFVLSKLQFYTQHIYYKTLGWKGILWTGWIGTPIHELGHVFFAKLFHHRIDGIHIFEPHEATGNLGHVDHAYNPKSLYQRVGNFFIGAAPMIWGAILLVTFLYFFVPNGKDIFAPLTVEQNSFSHFLSQLGRTLTHMFAKENIMAWNFWLFLYLSFSIASHMAPSDRDLKNMWKGFFWIVLMVIIVNALTLALGANITSYVLNLTQYLNIFTAIFVYAVVLSLVHLILASIVLLPFRKR